MINTLTGERALNVHELKLLNSFSKNWPEFVLYHCLHNQIPHLFIGTGGYVQIVNDEHSTQYTIPINSDTF